MTFFDIFNKGLNHIFFQLSNYIKKKKKIESLQLPSYKIGPIA